MMKTNLQLALAFTFCLLIGACGSGGANDCESAAKVRLQGMDEACSGKDAVCCFCKCFNDGHKAYDFTAYFTDGTCTCVTPQENGGGSAECTGNILEEAQACLADQIVCKAKAAEIVNGIEYGFCTNTPI